MIYFAIILIGQISHLLSAFGVCTMFAEGVLVRWMVPMLGEKLTLQIGVKITYTSTCEVG